MVDSQNFIAVNVQTTGLNPQSDQIIEVCIVRVRQGMVSSIFNTLVQPGPQLLQNGLDLAVSEKTGHTMQDLQGGVTEEDLTDLLTVFTRPSDGEDLLIAYNAPFHLGFIDALFHKYNIDPVTNPFIDPLAIARDRSPYPHKLPDMCAKMDIPIGEVRNAYEDTLSLVDLFLAMVEEDLTKPQAEKPIAWYIDKIGYNRKYGPPLWHPDYTELYAQGPTVVEHKKPAPNTTLPKYNTITINNSGKRKKLPDFAKMSNAEFSQEFMPTGFLAQQTLQAIERYMDDPFSKYHTGAWCELQVHGIQTEEGMQELNATLDYLKNIRCIPPHCLNSYLDNPDEATIVFRSPGPHVHGPIEISEEDLPF